MKSFSSVEKELVKSLRKRLNLSENIIDVKKEFEKIIIELFEKALPDLKYNAAKLSTDFEKETPKLELSVELKNNKDFMAVWNDSDLESIVAKFLAEASHRYKHIRKNSEKTNLKIKNH